MIQDKLYTADQAAELLGVSPWTIRRWVREGQLRAFRVGRLVRIAASDMDAMLTTVEPKTVEAEGAY